MSTGVGETASQRRSALAGPVVNNPSGLFKSLETTSHFGSRRVANSTGVRYPNALCGRCLLYSTRHCSKTTLASKQGIFGGGELHKDFEQFSWILGLSAPR